MESRPVLPGELRLLDRPEQDWRREMHRVVRPGGTALISDLRADARRSDINRHGASMGLNAVSAWLTRLIFEHTLRKSAYTAADMRSLVAQAGLDDCAIGESDITPDV